MSYLSAKVKMLTYQNPENGHIFIVVGRRWRVCGMYLYDLGEERKIAGFDLGGTVKSWEH